jgi:putative inorganic carbon (hco3(-)) transporter
VEYLFICLLYLKLLSVKLGHKYILGSWVFPVLVLPFVVAIFYLASQIYAKITWGAVFVLVMAASWLVSRFALQKYLLLLLALSLPFSIEVSISDNLNMNIPTEPILAIAFFSMGWDLMRKPGFMKQYFENESLWVLPLLLSYLITIIFSTIFLVSLKFSVVNLIYILVMFVWQKNQLKLYPRLFPKLLGLYSISLLVVIAFALFQFSEYGWYPPTIKGIFAPFYKDHTILGATTAILAVFWITIATQCRLATAKIFYGFAGLVFLAVVIFSNSRAAILSLIFSAFVWLILRFRLRLKYLGLGFIGILFLIAIFKGSIINLFQRNQYLSHNTQSGYIENLESSGNISTDISNTERLNRWISGFGMFADRPLTGFGPGTYQFVYIPYQKKEFMSRLTVKDPWHIPENSGGTAHSEYILLLSEMGLLGIAALFVLFGRWCWVVFEKSSNHPNHKLIIVAFVSLSTFLFHAFFNNFLNTDKFAFLFWGMAAWMVAQFESHEELILL